MPKNKKKEDHGNEVELAHAKVLEALINVHDSFKTELDTFLFKHSNIIKEYRLQKNDNQNLIASNQEVYNKAVSLLFRLNLFYGEVNHVELLLAQNLTANKIQPKFLFAIAKLYAFYVNYYSIFSAIENKFEGDFLRIAFHKVCLLYQSIGDCVHADKEVEIYFAKAICFYLKNWLVITHQSYDSEAFKNLQAGTQLFRNFISNTRTQSTKLHCMTHFVSLQSHIIFRTHMSTATSRTNDDLLIEYAQKIYNLTKNPSDCSQRLIHFFAEAAIFYGQIFHVKLTFIQKDLDAAMKHLNIPCKTTTIPYKKNVTTIVDRLKDFYSPKKIATALQHIIDISEQLNSAAFQVQTIFQDYEIVFKILAFYENAFLISEDLFCQLTDEDQKEHEWKSIYELLLLRKSMLEIHLRVLNILPLFNQNRDTQKQPLIKKLTMVIEKISYMNNSIKTAEINLLQLLSDEEKGVASDINLDKIKQTILKEQTLRNDFLKIRLNGEANPPSEARKQEIVSLFEKAHAQTLQLNLREAAKIYMQIQALVKDNLDLNYITAAIGLGDSYHNLALTENTSGNLSNQYRKKSLRSYENAIQNIQKYLEQTNLDEKLRPAYAAAKEIAESMVEKVQPNALSNANNEAHPKASDYTHESQQDKSSNNNHSKVKPKPTIVANFDLPLQSFASNVTEFLLQNGYFVAIVGGFVRDYLCKQPARDVDIVIYKFNDSHRSPEELLVATYELLKNIYPQSEFRYGKYPNIFLNDVTTIIEIAVLKIVDYKLTHSKLTDDLLLNLLFEDAKTRDTTDSALFYDIANRRLIDFFEGLKHIQKNKLRLIKRPQRSLKEDPLRIFRIIRFICQRSLIKSHDDYNSKLLNTIQQEIKAITHTNPDRFYSEIEKLFFRGAASATWEFMEKNGLLRDFFILPSDSDYLTSTEFLRSELLIKLMLSSLDKRIHEHKHFNPAVVFAAIFWPVLQEHLLKQSNHKYGFIYFNSVVNELFQEKKLAFNLPGPIFSSTITIWYIYLSKIHTYSIDVNLSFKLREHRCAYLFERVLSNATKLAPEQKAKQMLTISDNNFFRDTTLILKQTLKELISLYGITLEYKTRSFTVILPQQTCMTLTDQNELLRTTKQKLQLLLGRYAIAYKQEGNRIHITTQSPHKERIIRTNFEELFNLKLEFKSEIVFRMQP